MIEYNLYERDNTDSGDRKFLIDEDAILTLHGNCKIHGQLILGENCRRLTIRGDSLTLYTKSTDIGIGRPVRKNPDKTLSVSRAPLEINIDCVELCINVPRNTQPIGVQGISIKDTIKVSKNCKRHNFVKGMMVETRHTPELNSLYVAPRYVNTSDNEVLNSRIDSAKSVMTWNDEVTSFVHNLIDMDELTVQESFLDMCYAKFSMCHTPAELEKGVKEWFAMCTYLLWAYKYYRGVDFDYSLIRVSWLLVYRMEHMLIIEQPESLRYIIATDRFFTEFISLKNFSSLYNIILMIDVPKNGSKLSVTNRGIKIINAVVDNFCDIVRPVRNMNTLCLTVMGGNTFINPVIGETRTFCFACLCNSVYERFMNYMDIPTNEYIENERGELDMVLNYLKYMSVNIPANAMREQLPELLRVSSQLLGFNSHTDTNGINLVALWEEYVKHIDGSATQYLEVIQDYLHQVPDGSVSDEQIESLYKSCVDKINDMINKYSQCTFLFTATYSKELASMVDQESSAYFVYMWQANIALAQALICVKNKDIGQIAPVDLYTVVNDLYGTSFQIDKQEAEQLEKVYNDAMELGRSVKWGMWED